MACELHWDGTGRYLASVVTWFKQKSDNAVWFWNSVGRPLYQKMVTGLHIFAWRPFPPTLLSPEQIHVSLILLSLLIGNLKTTDRSFIGYKKEPG